MSLTSSRPNMNYTLTTFVHNMQRVVNKKTKQTTHFSKMSHLQYVCTMPSILGVHINLQMQTGPIMSPELKLLNTFS